MSSYAKNYEALYQQSILKPEQFWAEQAEQLTWMQPWQAVQQGDLAAGNCQWFSGGKLNVSVNCIDRHLPAMANKTAIIWEGDDPKHTSRLTYQDLYDAVCRFANVLKLRGIKKGDRVCLYMPMIPEALIAMLACARLGAIHSVVFGGFSPESLRNRILDADCNCVITVNGGYRNGSLLPFKANVDKALEACPNVHTVLVINHAELKIPWQERDVDYNELAATVSNDCPAELMDAEDPLFILYTSGSTGKPKGIVHSTAGYLLYAAFTQRVIFDLQPNDVYFCTADVGWITGHSYVVYGPLANGTTTLIFEGTPQYPSPSRYWEIIDKHQVSIFYTAPTAIRALMQHGDAPLQSTTRRSLRLLGSVGEPINPEAWSWYFEVVGRKRCPIMDTWWQTETGGIMIAPFGDVIQKPGAAMRPFFGIQPALLDGQNQEISGAGEGVLVIKASWPGMARTLYSDHTRFMETYFKPCPGYYFTGDGAKRDDEGDYWITGRIDDVLNVSGHRIGTAEIESALVLHSEVAEAAVVGVTHPIKGQGIYAFVTLMLGSLPSADLQRDLVALVRKQIGPVVTIDHIQFAASLPKTRSGKIMRRILRKIANRELDHLGDISTLANPECIEVLLKGHAIQN